MKLNLNQIQKIIDRVPVKRDAVFAEAEKNLGPWAMSDKDLKVVKDCIHGAIVTGIKMAIDFMDEENKNGKKT